jgi:transcription elongation factor GreA
MRTGKRQVPRARRVRVVTDMEPITAQGLAELQAELERLEGPERQAMAARIKTAREWGDLKENAEYHDAKNSQAHLETRIKRLRERLLAARVIEAPAGGQTEVAFGSTVEVVDPESGRRTTMTLVGRGEAKPSAGQLSIESPVAQALLGAKPGDTVAVTTPGGQRKLEVVAIS